MMPTISHSPTRSETLLRARTPPKTMLRSTTSSTDIGDLHLLDLPRVSVEPLAQQPLAHRCDLLTDPSRVQRQGQQQQQRANDKPHEIDRQRELVLEEPP